MLNSDFAQSHLIATSSEKTHQFLELIKKQNPTLSGFVKIYARREYIYAITYPDHQIYYYQQLYHQHHQPGSLQASLLLDPLEKNNDGQWIGWKRAYFVAASYNCCYVLVDRIVDGIISPDFREGYVNHELPNGECYEIPKRSSVVASVTCDMDPSNSEFVILNPSNTKLWLKGIDEALRQDEFITYMACGAYTLVLVTNQGRLIVGGSNGFGECGYDGYSTVPTAPHPFCEKHPNVKFCKVACGDHNIVALTQCGRIFVCGYNSSDELGMKNTGNQKQITESVEFAKITHSDPAIDVDCHYYGVIFLTRNGSVYVSGGSNRSLSKLTLPYLHSGTLFNTVTSIGAGSHSFLISLTNSNSDLLMLKVSRDALNISEAAQMKKEFLKGISSQQQRIGMTGSDQPSFSYIGYIQQRAVRSIKTLQKQLAQHLTNCFEDKSFADINFTC
ncbi:hypothetical protein C9374_008555 [Naegleria lovaniensis]|uniref:Uncharacterized protein n=1 Tax=Naegleria lovaniensis TaxID=51637 RepID=A0AA88KC19_NAELO|nr:uncharacterized protein C9374_012184 [Naegleria lovaniensis]XP_044545674.1 uncharacterized protein C9374_008555 [Naegleria lovaniensis]KAG2373445.1 hypothetical protein C9374_012184 [Naegleria lovaniensis]KAG2378412.1 hypothetical protein C9374_008555 [Naegleria lovaniensis]